MSDNLIRIIKDAKNKMEDSIPFFDKEIDRIIKNKNSEIREIEKLLDNLLDFGYMGIGKPQFDKLNKYYETLNLKNSNLYSKYYEELLEE